jgi:hypothetical protein
MLSVPMPRILDTIGDAAFVLNSWVDRHIQRRDISDTLVAAIFWICTELNIFTAVLGIGGDHAWRPFFSWFRPNLALVAIPLIVVYNLLVLYLSKNAKARMAGMAEDEIARRRSRAWTLLRVYFVLTIVSFVVAMLARHDWSK